MRPNSQGITNLVIVIEEILNEKLFCVVDNENEYENKDDTDDDDDDDDVMVLMLKMMIPIMIRQSCCSR